jgi:hypothetical protein
MSPAPRTADLSTAVPAARIAQRLGYAGLVPFVLGALLVWLVRDDALAYATLALSGYAAAVVAMLGGIHWGLGLRQSAPMALPSALPSALPFAWGVVPTVVASIAVIMPAHAGLVIHGAMLVVCYLVDRRVYPSHGLVGWLTLRFRLSAVAALCCFIGAAGA